MAEGEATSHFKYAIRRNIMNFGIVELALIAVIGLVAFVIVLAVIVFIIRKSK
jgi:ABC-type multidrug transport system permease subunit